MAERAVFCRSYHYHRGFAHDERIGNEKVSDNICRPSVEL